MEDFNVQSVLEASGWNSASKITPRTLNAARKLFKEVSTNWIRLINETTEVIPQGPLLPNDPGLSSQEKIELTQTIQNEKKIKISSLVELWITWSNIEKEAKQWKQVIEVFEQACGCSFSSQRAKLWIEYGRHYENRGKVDNANKQFKRSLSYVIEEDQRLEVLQAFYQFRKRIDSNLTLDEFCEPLESNDQELLISQSVELVAVVSTDDQIQKRYLEAENGGAIVSISESSSTPSPPLSHEGLARTIQLEKDAYSSKRKVMDEDENREDEDNLNRAIKREKGSNEILDGAMVTEVEVKDEFQVDDEEEEEDEEDNLDGLLLFPPTHDSYLSTLADVVDFDPSYELKYPISELAKLCVKAMYLLQLLKEKNIEEKYKFALGSEICDQTSQAETKKKSTQSELSDLLETQRTCLAEVELESFLPKSFRKKGTLSRNAAVIRAVFAQSEQTQEAVFFSTSISSRTLHGRVGGSGTIDPTGGRINGPTSSYALPSSSNPTTGATLYSSHGHSQQQPPHPQHVPQYPQNLKPPQGQDTGFDASAYGYGGLAAGLSHHQQQQWQTTPVNVSANGPTNGFAQSINVIANTNQNQQQQVTHQVTRSGGGGSNDSSSVRALLSALSKAKAAAAAGK